MCIRDRSSLAVAADNKVPLFKTVDLVSKLVALLGHGYGVQCANAAGALRSLAVAADNMVPLFNTADLVCKLVALLDHEYGVQCKYAAGALAAIAWKDETFTGLRGMPNLVAAVRALVQAGLPEGLWAAGKDKLRELAK